MARQATSVIASFPALASNSAGLRYRRLLCSRVPLYQPMYSTTARRAPARVGQDCTSSSSPLIELKNDSAIALSQPWPLRPRDSSTWQSLASSANAADVYWAAAVGVEDYAGPGVPGGFARVLGRRAPAYVTVELPDGPLPPPSDPRQVPGEVTEGGGYHYYPPRHLVRGWLAAAGFAVAEQADADSYWHLLLTRQE